MPDRIQLSRRRGWRIPENTLIVSRPHYLGNPFKVYQHCKPGMIDGRRHPGDWGLVDAGRFDTELGHGWTRLGAHRTAVNAYRQEFEKAYPVGSTARALLAVYLRGFDHLACWCPLEHEGELLPCHVDVLIELAHDPQHDALFYAMRETDRA